MDELKEWMETRLGEKLVEPNSGMGKAFEYMLKQWDRLTRFLTVAGAPPRTTLSKGRLRR